MKKSCAHQKIINFSNNFIIQVNIQKLTGERDYFVRNVTELEMELQNAISKADTTEKDAKFVFLTLIRIHPD